MANRATSPDSASSTAELPNVHGLSKASPHPEEWTLPHEWNIEKREMFENWKMDVQNQISNIAGTLSNSLRKHPRTDVERLDYSDVIEDNVLQKAVVQKERQAGNTLHYGLARVPAPNR
ncbi:uncharacterized protein LOC123562810 [Mercenaria mercenaria]|uniref:uncharacterized protein LOC123562810 n=1 Tax=Mercenaria mercenaria TaxID=6596 RepID=UPI001E1D6087|nr:uncharacterized protein LOC123562810 [Mercenaria mercenaria]XP_053392809.1 uncharacterized protein LOC123562810 [Mercenaria mercenaria]